jgi:uncharacterized protein (TIGR03905 family)
MKSTFLTKGTCAKSIELELEGGIVRSVKFFGGCDGNLQGVSRLVEGMSADEAARRLRGIRCGRKATSCPDPLAQAIEQALNA